MFPCKESRFGGRRREIEARATMARELELRLALEGKRKKRGLTSGSHGHPDKYLGDASRTVRRYLADCPRGGCYKSRRPFWLVPAWASITHLPSMSQRRGGSPLPALRGSALPKIPFGHAEDLEVVRVKHEDEQTDVSQETA